MNIFWLDSNIKKCAQYHCDKHICKMIVEYAQILSTVIRTVYSDDSSILYKSTHVNHPCTRWAVTQPNFNILYTLLGECLKEYTFRYEKEHKASVVYDYLSQYISFPSMPKITLPPLCMPDLYKDTKYGMFSIVQSYRTYYIHEKARFAKWAHSQTPHWWKEVPTVDNNSNA